MRYRIRYSSESEPEMLELEAGEWPDPKHRRDVQVIVQEHPDVGWHTQCRYDFYIWRDVRWVGVDEAGLFDFLEDTGTVRFNIGYRHEVKVAGKWKKVDKFGVYVYALERGDVLFGRTLTQRKFNSIMAEALKDLGEAKTGWLSGEKQPNG